MIRDSVLICVLHVCVCPPACRGRKPSLPRGGYAFLPERVGLSRSCRLWRRWPSLYRAPHARVSHVRLASRVRVSPVAAGIGVVLRRGPLYVCVCVRVSVDCHAHLDGAAPFQSRLYCTVGPERAEIHHSATVPGVWLCGNEKLDGLEADELNT